MKFAFKRSIVSILLVLGMVLSFFSPLSGLIPQVYATDSTVTDYDSMTINEILALDENLTWVFAGDSITHNASFTNGMNSYPEWFEQYLYTLGRQDKVINTAWGGAVVEDFLYYDDTPNKYGLKDNDETGKGIENMITNYNADVIFIKLGMNNRGTATETFKAYYTKMLDAIYAEGLKNNKIPKVIVITPTPLAGDSLQGKVYFADKKNVIGAHNVWRFQMILEELVPDYNTANGKNIEFVDFMTGFTSEELVVGDAYAGTFFTDGSDGGLHPNQAAQYLMFKILCKSLELYDENEAIFQFSYEEMNGEMLYTDDTHIGDYTGSYHSVNAPVAYVGESKYDTFAAAFQAAVNAGTATITLCADVTLTAGYTVPAGVSITITDDGTARTITRGDTLTAALFTVNGTLTFTGNGGLTVDGNNVSATGPVAQIPAGGTVKVDPNTSFVNHKSTGSAGVFNVAGTADSPATLTVDGAVFTGNTGTSGGVIYNGNYAVTTVSNSAFTGNTATASGGAVYCEDYSSVKLTGCSLTENTAPSGSAIQIAANNGNYRLTLKNCDITNNKNTYAIHAWRDAYITLDGCQFSGNAAGDMYFTNSTNGSTKPDDYQFVYILASERASIVEVYLGNNAYPVRIGGTLADGSSVKLNWAKVPTGTAVQFDDAEAAVANKFALFLADALAVNYQYRYNEAVATVIEKPTETIVAQMGDQDFTSWADLAAAVNALTSGEVTVTILSDVTADTAITVPSGVTVTLKDDGTARTIFRDASLTGTMFTVNGTLHFASTSTTADVADGVATGAASKLTISGGSVAQTAVAVAAGNGGHIKVSQGVRFTGMTAGSGGGVISMGGNLGATLTITGGKFDGNTNAALWAGTVSAWGGNTVTIKNAVFANNSGTNIGALYLFKQNSSYIIDNCAFNSNSGKYGGAISMNEAMVADISNSTFTGNTATNRGGAITLDGAATCNLTNCTFTNNTVNGADHAIKIHKAGGKVVVDGTPITGVQILTNAQVTSVAAAVMSLAEETEEIAPPSWKSLVDENNTWVIAGTEQVFGYESLNVNRSIFRYMDGSVRCWWPYKDNRFVQAQGSDVAELLASFEADTGIMAAGQDIDIYLLIPQVNAVYETGYAHSADLVAAYKTTVQAIADKAKAAGMTMVLWTPFASNNATINGYIDAYAAAVREIGAADDSILLFDANKFMNEHLSNTALAESWFTNGADISPLLASDLVRAFWSKAEMCDSNLLNEVVGHNLRVGTDKRTYKGDFLRGDVAYNSVSVSGENVTVDASAITSAYPGMTNLRVAILPVAGCGNYNESIWDNYAAISGSSATFAAPWDNAVITVYGELSGKIYRFRDVTLNVTVANDKSLPVYTTDALTDLCVVGAPAFDFKADTNTYTVNVYQYQKYVQIRAEGGKNLTVTVNGETVKVGALSQEIEIPQKTATVTVAVTGGAADATYTLNLVKPDYPDIIITEVLEDPNYSSGLYEMIELYNASGKDLNIKDYALGYKIESTYALIADDGSGNAVDGGLTPDRFTGDDHIFHAVSGTGATFTSINDLTVPETVTFPANSTMVVWVKQNWQTTKDTESYEDLINAVKAAAGDSTLVVSIDGVDTPVAPTADKLIMAEDVNGNDGGQDTFSNHTSENASDNFYLENSGVAKRFWLFVTKAGAVRDDNGSITEAGDDILSAARWNRATAVAGWSTALTYNIGRGFALPYAEGTEAAADTKTTFGAIEYWQKPLELDDETAPAAKVTETESGLTIALSDNTDVRYLYLQIDADGDGTYETTVTRDFVLEAGVKNAGVHADQTAYTYTYTGDVVTYQGYVLDGNNLSTEFATPVYRVQIEGGDKYETLEEAIAVANTMDSATIILLKDVTLESTCTVSGNITITDNGSARTIYRGSELTGKIFDIAGSLSLVGTAAEMLTIDGASVSSTVSAFVVTGGLTVENVMLKDLNSGGWAGGALFYLNGGPAATFTDVSVTSGSGMVFYIQGAASDGNVQTFTNCTFENRSFTGAGAILNGASGSNVKLSSCTFTNNQTTHRGMIYVEKSTYTIENCTFDGNKSTNNAAGAICVVNTANSVVNISGSTFTNNSATSHGGAIWARGGNCTVNISNSSFSGNTAGGLGEGIMAEATTKLTLDGCSVSDEVYMVDASVNPATIKTTEQATSLTMNIAKGSVNVSGTLAEGSEVTLNWGTVPTGTAVQFDSAEAAAANIGALKLSDSLTESGYVLRVSDSIAEVLIPTMVAQVGETKYETLAEAIAAANALESGTVILLADATLPVGMEITGNVTITDDGNAHTINRSAEGIIFTVSGTLNITGTAKSMITINGGDIASTTACFVVTGSVHLKNVDIKDMNCGAWGSNMFYLNKGPASSFENVNFSGGSGQVFYVQGAASDGNAQTFINCTFKDYTGTANGSIINSAAGANLTITGCTFENINNGAHGGVIYVDRSTYNISDSIFKNNSCGTASGGAICVSNQSGAWNNLYLTNCQFIGNSAGKGGAIWLRGNAKSATVITGCTFTDNISANTGGAILADANANLTVDGCTFSGNTATGDGNDIYIFTADAAKHIFKTTEKAMDANVYIYSGAIKVEGTLLDGSALDLTWGTYSTGIKAVQFDDYPAALANKAALKLTGMDGYSLLYADDSSIAALYNDSIALADVYLSSTGADTNAGTSDAPVASLNKALELVKNGGTIHIVDSYTAPSDFVWNEHSKDVTITGGTLDFSAMGNGIDFYQNDAVTYDNLTLTTGGWIMYFANGHRLQINENVTVTKTDTCLFGGGGYCYADSNALARTVYGTDVTVLSGTWFKLYGGGRVADVDGDSKLYVGGTVNAGHTVEDNGSTQLAYGGGYNCSISGDIYLTIADNAKLNFVYGGLELGEDANYAVGGDVHVLMSGGQVYSIYGGHKATANGSLSGNISLTITGGTAAQVFGANRNADQVGNVKVYIKGGTITRRIYGGCYNDTTTQNVIQVVFTSNYHVQGRIDLWIYENANITLNEDNDNSIYAHSRHDGSNDPFADEDTWLYFATPAAQTAYEDKLGATDTDMQYVMGSTTVADHLESMDILQGVTTTLGNALTMDFILDINQLDGTGHYAVMTWYSADGRTETMRVDQADWQAYGDSTNLYYPSFTGLAAKEMADTVELILYNASGEIILNAYTDSLKDYAMRMLAKDEVINDAALRAVYVDMLNYGAEAQKTFNYNTSNLANSELTSDEQVLAAVSVEDSRKYSTGYKMSALALKNNIILNFIFTNDVLGDDISSLYAIVTYTDHYGTSVEKRIEGDQFQPYGINPGHYIGVDTLAIADGRQDVTITVYDANGNTLTSATDSVASYVARMGASSAMGKAVMNFVDSAKAYFESLQ